MKKEVKVYAASHAEPHASRLAGNVRELENTWSLLWR